MKPLTASACPALFEIATGRLHSLISFEQFVVGRSPDADLPVTNSACSRQQFRLLRQQDQWLIENLSKHNSTVHNGAPVVAPIVLAHGDVIQVDALQFEFRTAEHVVAGTLGFSDEAQLMATSTALSAAPSGPPTQIGASTAESSSSSMPSGSIAVHGQLLIGRDKGQVQILVDDPNVSRIHAQVQSKHGRIEITDLKSTNGTFHNGRQIETVTALKPGDRIDIGPMSFVCDGQNLIAKSRANNVELVGRSIRRIVPDRLTGMPLTLLDGINLVIRPKEFVCLLGPSGSGKSTLLSALSARVPATSGSVTLNQEDLYLNFEALKRDIAVVHQKDVMHDLLPVEVALNYTARLRLPADTTSAEIRTTIRTLLESVGLTHRRAVRIRDLSGGQLKRASLANEIISRPSLLFLDEVTSGLDEQTDREMMQLFRKVADEGKTVVCITHSVANVEQNCDLIVVLTVGGKLAFLGPPAEGLSYFQVRYLGDIYEKLAEAPAEVWQQRFEAHPCYSKYIDARMPPDESWEEPVPRRASALRERAKLFRYQLVLLTSRYFRIRMADSRSLLLMMGQCLLVAALLSLLFGDLTVDNANLPEIALNSRSLLFLMAVSTFWFGCNNSATEIVKERVIFSREVDVNLLPSAYYASKLILLGVIGVTQSMLLLLVVHMATAFSGNVLTYAGIFALLNVTGTAMGLLLSSLAKTEEQAVTLVPLVLIPQIILAGVISKLSGMLETFSEAFITTFWGMRALIPCLDDKLVTGLGAKEWSTKSACQMLALHFGVLVVTTLIVQALRDGRGSRFGRALARDRRRTPGRPPSRAAG